MQRVKEVSAYVPDETGNNPHWGPAIPIGADDENIDITSATTQPDGSTVIDIQNDSNMALDTDAVIVQTGDTGAEAWTKFNRFRKRVINNINNLLSLNNIKDEYQNTGASNEVYSTNLINNYMSQVIGYSGTTTPADGTINAQLLALNQKAPDQIAIIDYGLNTTVNISSSAGATVNLTANRFSTVPTVFIILASDLGGYTSPSYWVENVTTTNFIIKLVLVDSSSSSMMYPGNVKFNWLAIQLI